MAETRVAAILRSGIFSPNHIGNDAAILHAVASELRLRGCHVKIYSESEFCREDIEEDVVVAMCRGDETVRKIQTLEEKGRIVVNSGYGIENCVRIIMVRLLQDACLPLPECFVVETDVNVRKLLENAGFSACWVKKGEAPVHHLEDITRCRHPQEAQEILHEFFFRKISSAVVSRDIPGEKIRCYGIASSGWFHCFMPFREDPHLLEENDDNGLYSRVKDICMRAASILKVDIFGCDLVLSDAGECYLVNFDDWPSFAPIRKEAAKAIAKSIMARVKRQSAKRRRS